MLKPVGCVSHSLIRKVNAKQIVGSDGAPSTHPPPPERDAREHFRR